MSSKMTRFESLLEAVPDALVGMSQKGVIRFVNRQAESLFGYDRDDMVGQRIEMLVPERLWQIYTEHQEGYFADLRTRSSGVDLVLSGRQRDGTEFPVNISLSHIDTGDVLLVVTAVRDVTSLHQAVETAQLTAAVVEYSDDAIIGSTLEGIVTSWNPAAERMYGYSSKEILGRSASRLIPLDRAGELFANLDKVRQGQTLERLETERVRKDGTLFPVSLTVAPIRNEDGAIVGVSAVHRDVTEQRRALELAQRIEAIVEGSDDAIIGETLEGVITSWNPAATRMYGYSGEEIIGKSVGLLIPGDRAGEAKAVVAKVSAGQHVEHLETFNARKDGTLFPVSLTVSPVRGADGAIVGASVICRDLTAQEHAAQYARSLVEAGLDPLVTISLEGRITDANQAMVTVTGVPREAIIGSDFAQYVTEPDKAAEAYRRVLTQGSLTDVQLTVRHRDGTETDVLCNFSVFRGTGGNVLGVLATGRDVTRQNQAFELAQRMEAIVEGSDDAIIGRTLEGIITSWNPAAERMYGYRGEEVIGQSVAMLIPEDRTDEMRTILGGIRAGQRVESLETIRVRKDGTVFPISLTVSPIRGAGGAIVGASVICRDLTEQEHAAQYARSLIEAALDPMVTISPEGQIDDVNEAAVRLTGVRRDELIGTGFSGYFTDPGKAAEIHQRAFAQGSVTDYPLTLRHRAGTLTDLLLNASVYRDTGGKVLGVLVAARELNGQK
ncbi:MAG TPA: PAS domain S-box protein [Dermatophilaceae bacterium]